MTGSSNIPEGAVHTSPSARARPEFAAFYSQHYREIARALAVTMGDRDLGYAAADEAMARASANWSSVQQHEHPAGRVYRSGYRWARSLRTRAARRLRGKQTAMDAPPAGSDWGLYQALASLDVRQRAILVCRFMLDWVIQDTADALDTKPGTVENRTARALSELEVSLHRSGKEGRDVEEALSIYFADQHRALDPEGTGAVATASRGAQYRRRRIPVLVAGGVAVLAMGGLGAWTLRTILADDGGTGTIADSASSGRSNTLGNVGSPAGSSDASPATTIVDGTQLAVASPAVSLEWYATGTSLGWSEHLFASTDGLFYALSTAPGARWGPRGEPPQKALYWTADGEEWQFNTLGEDLWSRDASEFAGTVYLIGTSPAMQTFDDDAAVTIHESSDQGASWSHIDLPVTAVPPRNLGAVNWAFTTAQISAGSSGVVAAVQTRYHMDLERLAPLEFRGDFMEVRPTAEGLEVIDWSVVEDIDFQCSAQLGASWSEIRIVGEEDFENLPEPCQELRSNEFDSAVVFSATWEELGLPDAEPTAYSELFVSAEGVEFENVPSPFAPTGRLIDIKALGQGFFAIEGDERGGWVRAWRSPDGRTWEQDLGFPQLNWTQAIGEFQGSTVVVGGTDSGLAVAWQSPGESAWESIDLEQWLPAGGEDGGQWVSGAAVGDAGVLLAVQSWNQKTQQQVMVLLHGTQKDEWTAAPIPTPGGIGEFHIDSLAVGADRALARLVTYDERGESSLQLIGAPGA